MNRIERSFAFGQEAKIRYLDGEFQVLRNGTYVRCAVTGEPIRLEDLRYWSVAFQEPYANAAVSLRRHLERLKGDGR
jgi:hypothetical protein